MTSYQLVEALENTQNIINNDEEFFNLVNELSSVYDEYIVKVNSCTTSTDNNFIVKVCTESRAIIQNINNFTHNIQLRQFYKMVEHINTGLSVYNIPYLDGNNIIADIVTCINAYESAYQSYTRDRSITHAKQLIDSAKILKNVIDKIEITHKIMTANLNISVDIPNGTLQIILENPLLYSEFNAKLIAIEKIYLELCSLYNISVNDEPLRIINIESGSMYAKITGNLVVISLMLDLLTGAFEHSYNVFTESHKFTIISKKLETLDQFADLTNKLEEAGIDTSKIKDNLNKSAVKISSELNCLIAGEPSVSLNGKKLSIPKKSKEKYISQSKKYLLENNQHLLKEIESELVTK